MADGHLPGFPKRTLSPEEVYADARIAGFNDAQATIMTAIASPESGYDADILNDTPSTGDLSYGLTQINMLGAMGPERRKQFGISDNTQLFDPITNLRAAYEVSNHGRTFTPWSTYQHGSHTAALPRARQAAAKVGPDVESYATGGPKSGKGGGGGGIIGAVKGAAGAVIGLPSKVLGGVASTAADAAGNAVSDAGVGVVHALEPLVLKSTFTVLGLALVGVGVWRLFGPQIKSATSGASQAAGVAAMAAV